MILDYTRRFCFIHIPRTGGVSITSALRAGCPDCDLANYWPMRHATALEIKAMLGDEVWNGLFRFAVMRSPWDIVETP